MTDQKGATGPPIAMDRPAGQPYDLPKDGNTRIVELPQGKPRHDRPQGQTSIPSPKKDQAALPAPPTASGTATPEPTTVLPATSDEVGGTAGSKAPTRKVLAAGAGGGGLGVPISIILGYYVLGPETPPEVVAAWSGMIVAILSFGFGYLVPAEK